MIKEILTLAAASASIIETQVKKAERNETLDLGALTQTAADLRALNAKLQGFKNAADAVGTDDEFAKLVRDSFTRSEGG